ncbi:MAG: CAP domain-containing protein [Chloroflexi bacterium]|nr:CAP domain-containing protein [Chloroflexota bacterium]
MPDEMWDPMRRPRGVLNRQPQKRDGPVRIPLLLLCMALAAAVGWVIGDDELQARIGDMPDNIADWWEEQSASWAAMPTPTPTPAGPPHLRHLEYKQQMLGLINAERERAGVGLVTLGDNNAAQLHAESGLKHCISSHWGVDGLKPYMRYTLAGGYQSNGENGRGLDYCISASDWVRSLDSLDVEVEDAVRGWMGSPGHRRNILDPTHQKVNIGLAWDRYNINAVQHFEGDYVVYDALPAIAGGTLSLQGTLKNGAVIRGEDDLGVQVYFDPPPHPLTAGQLSRTYCYTNGLQVASLRPPLTGGWFYDTHEFTQEYGQCPDPYAVPLDASAPGSPDEASLHYDAAKAASGSLPPVLHTVPWITAQTWRLGGDSFTVTADINSILNQYGPGVYTIVVWARLMGDDNVVSEYSIFHEVTPPDTYSWP